MNWISLRQVRFFAAAFVVFAGLSPAAALNVQPLSLEMVAIGQHSRGTIQIVNDGAKPVPVEVSVKRLDIALDGKTSETDASNDFLIFPPQAVVQPGATQSFRIQWAGAPDLQKEPNLYGHGERASGENEAGRKRRANGVQLRRAGECRSPRRAA